MLETQEVKEFASFPGLKEAAAKFKAQAPVEQVSVEPTVVSNTGTEEVKQPVVVEDTPKEQPKVETPEATPQEIVAEVEKPWDEDSSEPAKVEAPTYDFSKLGSALKLEGIKSESDIVSKFNELQTKLQQAESKKEATFEGVPDELREVIDLAKSGVDWKSYAGISTVDWSKVNPIDLFENEFSRLPQFRNADGTLNEQLLNDQLDAIPDGQKAYEGNRVIQQRIQEQQQLKAQQVAQARQRKEQADKQLLEATRNLSEIFPEKEYGVKFEAKHSDELFKGISSGELMRQYFTDENGNYDMRKVVETIAMRKYGHKMIKYHAEKAKVAAKKEILNSTQNVQLETTRTSVAPDGKEEQKLSPAERMLRYVEKTKGAGHL